MSSGLLLVVIALVAITDWWSVWQRRPKVERIAKPLVMVLLIFWVAASQDPNSVQVWLVAALAFGLVGDVLLLPAVDNFIGGLASFLVGHLLYVVAALAYGIDSGLAVMLGVLVALVAVSVAGRPIWDSLQGSRLQMPVAGYIAVIAATVTAVIGTGNLVAIVGVCLFALSDALLGHTRFVSKRQDLRAIVHATYHLGQGLLAVGLMA